MADDGAFIGRFLPLFVSPRTVSHHLYNAYPKLGVSRRAQLGQFDP